MLLRIGMSEVLLSRLLVEAIEGGDVTSVSGVLDRGADVNSRDDQDVFEWDPDVCVVY